MSRSEAARLAGLVVTLGLVAALAGHCLSRRAPLPPIPGTSSAPPPPTSGFSEARARLAVFRSYRELFERDFVRAARVQEDGAVRIEVDLRALARPALLRRGWSDLEDAIPSGAVVTVRQARGRVDESFSFACSDGCLLDLFAAAVGSPPGAPFPLPGTPSALAVFTLDRKRLADFAYGDGARRALRQRADVLEQILGRPIRVPVAEDLSGAGVIALYPEGLAGRARVLLALELRRSDRVRSLVDLALGLASLTRGAVITRHDDVAIGSWSEGFGGLAVAVDGPFLLLANDRLPLEEALDQRRGNPQSSLEAFPRPDPLGASLTIDGGPSCRARLTREGERWRLDSSGDRPLLESEAVRGWVRSVRPRFQRGEG